MLHPLRSTFPRFTLCVFGGDDKEMLNNMTLTTTSILILLLALVMSGCEGDTNSPEEKSKVGEIAPDFSLPDTDGNSVSLSDYKNKNIVVLDFYRGYG